MNTETSFSELLIDPLAQPSRPPSTTVLMAEPTYFDVEYVINPHMAEHVGGVDRDRASRQWAALKDVYEGLGLVVEVLPAEPGLVDLVFIANQSFPTQPIEGPPTAILSNMHAPQRRAEVPVVARWLEARGWRLVSIEDEDTHFEGMGDVNWHPGRRVVYGGFGWRTTRNAYSHRNYEVDAPVVALELVDTRMYHLDTCFSPLDEHTALICAEAFTPQSLALLEASFPRLLRAPLDEAVGLLSCNGHCPDQRHFIVQRGASRTNQLVREAGFEVVEVDTSEFLKSGGSVQCMKLMLD
ncbi:MAG TPA: amidinotransferase [Deltaproteobacteria bacterium]|nr:amidinotransferase [Deltaproteobacteria bacterium]